ncbi:MAG: nickel pincer cofactor biosynthesis protein LarC [Dehalococcoidia bacterium]|nr:nickel pincer cofactor biosynthesis protein LarC [Dehalococcoidia bacterium]
MTIAYFDLIGGASGDMTLGALADAGLDMAALESALRTLPVRGYRLEAERVRRGALSATRVRVRITRRSKQPRTLADLLAIVRAGKLPTRVREQAAAIFRRLAEVEAKVHDVPVEQVHFHELGAVDTVVDVVGACLGLHLLGVDQVYASPLPLGHGLIRSDDGPLPLPAPATLELAARAKAPLRPDDGTMGETVTPTGAAILTTLAEFRRPAMRLERVGYGAGGRDTPERPNVLAVWLGQPVESAGETPLALLETNIDDMDPRIYGHLMERLLEAGARDAWYTPIQMKKGRPATMVSVLATPDLEGALVGLLLRETTTLGVRVRDVRRHEAQRESVTLKTSLGEVPVKVKRIEGKAVGATPEYDVCRRIAREKGMPLVDVLRRVQREAEAKLLKGGDKRA